ncbi:hypothetical protein BDL97_02G194900 [Sphagnum fallax]|nr:hypothetical protein BDL97_02G194900 [Sphagnum fallax]
MGRPSSRLAAASSPYRIMPSLWCKFDRMWYGHNGKLDGTKTHQPFLCPLDHVFDIDQMLAELDNLEFGPGIGFWAYSFLESPLVTHELITTFDAYKNYKILQFSTTEDAFGGFLDVVCNSHRIC